MPNLSPKFALNHMICPRFTASELIQSAATMGLKAVELRNDVQSNSVIDLAQARDLGTLAKRQGIEILSINALYPFNIWNEERKVQAEKLASLVQACGGRGLVLCPLVDANNTASADEKQAQLSESLQALAGILEKYEIQGYVEALGFPISSIRTKRQIIDTISALGLSERFGLVHDTFHHVGAQESEFFAKQTGLVHISGVEDPEISFDDMLDSHRLLVGPNDRLNSVEQIKTLLTSGYDGYISFEPFAESVWNLTDPLSAVQASMDFIHAQLNA
ncbi:TIM barrel protein [Nitrincola nitratireducens]|uniref:Inosose isomerase n=1 Tax=Nitrincola nitratireducens TaxID=1229521 RepID=W9UXS6_9GAMM|nr:TIM barrel protein [Nitrincola nitratireducens]EXJ11854.1 Inosose isomerase [Nitrincola nitratireducens]